MRALLLSLVFGLFAPVLAAAPVVQDVFRVGGDVYVRSLAVEPERDALWVGTSTGVLEVDLNTHQVRNTFTRDDGLANEYVFAIGLDRSGHKWFGTNGGGASRYRDGQWRVYFPLHGLADYWIYAFTQQRNGDIWIGTWAGANRLDAQTGELHTYVSELINEWVYALDTDSQDRVWFGTEGGVSMYDGETWTGWSHADGIGAPNRGELPVSPNTGLGTRQRHDLDVMLQGRETYNPGYVFSLIVDEQDRVWAGTWGGGVSVYEDGEWRHITTDDGLSGNIVYSIARTDDGAFWFGTNRGISRYDGENWTRYGTADGLPGNDFYALAVSADGSVWAGTLGAVVRLAPRKESTQ